MECIRLMTKTKLAFIFLAISMLVAGATSCSGDDVKTTGNESYIHGSYSSENLNFTLDGISLQNVVAAVTVENGVATITLTGFPEDTSTVTWISAVEETENGTECSGEYTASDNGQVYRYTVLFQGSYDSISCKIECEIIN